MFSLAPGGEETDVQNDETVLPPPDERARVLPVMRVKRSTRLRRAGLGRLQREAARRRASNRTLAIVSLISLAGLVALFYEILVS